MPAVDQARRQPCPSEVGGVSRRVVQGRREEVVLPGMSNGNCRQEVHGAAAYYWKGSEGYWPRPITASGARLLAA